MGDNYLITGYWGEPHVTVENDRGINAAIFGTGRFVLPVGKQFLAEYIGNNTVRMYDGKLLNNGAAAGIPAGRYVDLLIPEARQGMKRNDLIVFQYTKDASTLIESGTFVVVTGAETSGTPEDPELTHEDLLSNEAAFDQMPLWRVPVSATVISAPVQLFDVSKNMKNAGTPVVKATSGDGIAYSATVPGVSELYAGLEIVIVPKMASASTAITLDINGMGAKLVRLPVSTNTAVLAQPETEGYFVDNRPVKLMYDPEYAGKGSWVAIGRQRQSGNDIYGQVPIENGGTGADTLAEAQENLQIHPAQKSTDHPGCYFRTVDGATEWINPPMKEGVEYRTTARFMGAPVFTKVVAGEAPASGASDTVTIAMGVTGLIRLDGYTIVSGQIDVAAPMESGVCKHEISTAILRAVVDNSGGTLTESAPVIFRAWYIKETLSDLL